MDAVTSSGINEEAEVHGSETTDSHYTERKLQGQDLSPGRLVSCVA